MFWGIDGRDAVGPGILGRFTGDRLQAATNGWISEGVPGMRQTRRNPSKPGWNPRANRVSTGFDGFFYLQLDWFGSTPVRMEGYIIAHGFRHHSCGWQRHPDGGEPGQAVSGGRRPARCG